MSCLLYLLTYDETRLKAFEVKGLRKIRGQQRKQMSGFSTKLE